MTLLTTAFAQGTHAARPAAAAANQGYYYFETDTQTLFQSTGSAWTQIAASPASTGSPLTTKGDLYGHSTVDARVPIGTDGQALIADSGQALGLKWANTITTIFDTTLGVDTASFDTGAGGIPGGFSELEVLMMLRTDEAAAVSNANLTLNNDSGANYDVQGVSSNNSTNNASAAQAQTSILFLVHGTGGSASYAGVTRLLIPFYDGTTFYKTGLFQQVADDATATNNWYGGKGFTWRNTGAITRLAIAAAAGQKFKAGSRLVIKGRP